MRALGSWEEEKPVWRGCWDRYRPADPAVDISGHLTGMPPGQWVRTQVWEPGVRSAALTTAHSSFHGAQTRLDCEERLHRYNCSIDGPLLMDGVGRILGILVFLYCC